MTTEELKRLNAAQQIQNDIDTIENALQEIDDFTNNNHQIRLEEESMSINIAYPSGNYLEISCEGKEEKQLAIRILNEYKISLERKLSDLKQKFAAI